MNLSIKAKENDTFKRYVKERLKPELEITGEIDEVELVEKCIEKMRHKDNKPSNHHRVERLEEQLSEAMSEKVSLENKI